MKHLVIALAVLIAALSPAIAQDRINEPLRTELLQMGRRDQEAREKLVPLVVSAAAGPPSQEIVALIAKQRQVDETNFRRLDEIVAEYGWPGKTLVGKEASDVAHLLVQHSDLERQKHYLPMLKSAASAGEVSAANVAMLEDRIRHAEGKKQVYGSEFELGPNGGCVIVPIDDPLHVDERREAVGLPPMREYLKQVEDHLGAPCVIKPDAR